MVRRARLPRAVLAACGLSLVSTAAVAGWEPPVTAPGVVRDVLPVDAGQLAVATSTGAGTVAGGALGTWLTLTGIVTTFVDSEGCLAAMDINGWLYAFDNAAAGCGKYVGGIPTQVGDQAQRLRVAHNGYGFVCSSRSDGTSRFTASSTAYQTWPGAPLLTTDRTCTRAISVLGTPTASYALAGVDYSLADQNLLLLRDSTIVGTWHRTQGSSRQPPRSVALIEEPTGGARAFVVNAAGGLETGVIDGGLEPMAPVAQPGGTSFQTLALYRRGPERHGLAIAQLSDGGTRVLSAVPNPDPLQFGRVWRELGTQPQLGGPPVELSCVDGRFCGIASAITGAANVAAFVNAAPPTITPQTVTIAEGLDASVTLAVQDPDGEAVWLSWTQMSAGVAMPVVTGPDGVTAQLSAPVLGGICADGGVPFTYNVTATDGLASHSSVTPITVVVTRSSPALQPTVSPDPLQLTAGAPPASVSAVRNPQECSEWGYDWPEQVASGIKVNASSGATTTVEVPRNVCQVGGITQTFVVYATSPYGASPPANFNVKVLPWGPPEPPLASAMQVTHPGGTTETYARTQSHVCNDGGTLVDVLTTWTLDGGLPPQTTLVPDPAAGSVQVVSADRCDRGGFELVAQNSVQASGTSDPSSLFVEVQPDLDPLTQAQLAIARDGASLAGSATVSGINCLDARTLAARFVVEDQGQVLSETVLPVPGAWALPPLEAVCSPRTVSVQAVLEDTGGAVRSNTLQVDPPLSAPALGTLTAGPLLARCEGEDASARVVARGPLVHDRAGAGCTEQQTRWSVEGGAPLAEGDQATAVIEAPAWDELLDRTLALQAVAFAGTNQTQPAGTTAAVELAEVFVEGRLEADAPLASETGLLGLRVVLANTSACPVRDARFALSLRGVSYVEGSARLEERLAAVGTGDAEVLEISGIELGAGATGVLTLSVRPELFGTPAPRGQLFIGAEPISAELRLGERVETTGCGCGAAGGAGLWAGLIGLWSLVRRWRLRARS